MRENRTYGLMRGRAYPERDAPPYSTGREWWSSGVVPNHSTFPPFHFSTRNATGGTPVGPVAHRMPIGAPMSGFEKPPRRPPGRGRTMWLFGPQKGLFLSIGCNRKLQSDSRAEAHPIDARTSIGWKLSCQSDAPSRFNPLRFRVSIH